MRWLRRGLAALVLLLVLAVCAAWLTARLSLPKVEGRVEVAGLKAPVEIFRGSHGIPRIFARDEADAYFALGYVHAQDRLWQMELNRRIPAGRLAGLVGEPGVRIDRFMRTLGIYEKARASLASLSPETRAAIDAYTAGVNAWMQHHSGPLPPEFLVLGARPEPWRPVDCILWGALMALRLDGNWREELLRARLSQRLDPSQMADLYPPYPAGAPTTLAFDPSLYRGLPLRRLRAAVPAAARRTTASNEWVIGSRRSVTDMPILANDPHLGFTAPGLWYLARIETPTLSLAGATVPGVPFMVLGHNRSIAWGFTTTTADTSDLFVEKIDPADSDRYLVPGGSRRFVHREETIRVRGGRPLRLDVRETRHGPVIDDVVRNAPGAAGPDRVLALSAAFLKPGNTTAEALYRLNHAQDWRDFTAALRDWKAPVQNVVYADVEGHIGLYVPGRIPVRPSGDGSMPVPGWDGAHDWSGFVPFDELPHILDPASGEIVNANNKVVGPGYPYFIGRDWEAPYRARRILQLLAAKPRLGLDDMARIQADTLSLAARDLLPLLLSFEPDSDDRARRAEDMLRAWDGHMDRSRPEPLIYTAWLLELSKSLFADELGPGFREYMRLRPRVLRRMLTVSPRWCDDIRTKDRTETCAEIVAGSLDAALARLDKAVGGDMKTWRWGDLHKAEFRHALFSRIPLLRRIADITIATDGGDYTVNRGTTSIADPDHPFAHVHGAGYRAVYDLSNLAASRFMQATGESGNPASGHYRDLVPRWRDFAYIRLGRSLSDLRSGYARRMILAPPPATQ